MAVRVATTDLFESSFLHCRGAALVEARVDRAHRSRTGETAATVVFVFEGNGQLTELQRAYHTGTATVNLADFRTSLVHLRRRLHAALSNPQPEGTRCHAPAPEPATAVVS
jgi:hypothetical protein